MNENNHAQTHTALGTPAAPQVHRAFPFAVAVDSSEAQLDSLQKLLAARGIGLLRAHTAADGLALAQLHVPDLIVAALSVRGLSTLDFLVAAKADQRLARVPFVVLSGAPAHADHQRRHCMSLGADAFLYRKE
ncbi:MAG: response regulator [Alphaproteobacteria bacterium]|nr:response regulator [Alphaproteobacteria bacterium]